MLWVARKIYKVETTYKRIFSTFQFAGLPFSILTIPIGIVLGIYLTTLTQQPGLESAYGVVGITWGTLSPIIIHLVILTILAAKQSFQLTTLQVIAVWIISTVVIISIFIPIGIVLGVLGAFNVF